MSVSATRPAHALALDRLLRTAHARLVRESASRELVDRRSFSAALADARGRVVVATAFAPIANIEALVRTCGRSFAGVPADDVLLTNDPYSGGTRVQDHFAIAPFVSGDGEMGYAVTSAAVADVGGMTLGNDYPDAGDLWTEGVRTTPVRIVRRGEVDADVIRLLEINSRLPLLVVADARLLAAVAASVAAQASIAAAEPCIGASREAIAARARASRTTERTGSVARSPHLRVVVTTGDGRVRVEFADSADAQRDNSGNATAATVASAVVRALASAAGCELNSGVTDALDLDIPVGSCLDAQFPFPVGAGRYVIGEAIHDMALDALEEVLDEA